MTDPKAKRIKRRVDGVLLLDKPEGISSNTAMQKARILLTAAKAGHTGNLDPIATGLLPVCLGEATKYAQVLLDADKVYRAVFRLGEMTLTGDREGEIMARHPVNVSEEAVQAALAGLTGEVWQVPPMYSALKHKGKPLYEYARQGIELERAARKVTIYSATLEHFDGRDAQVKVHCSKGTYIRVLGEDLGQALGCGAHMISLRRLATGCFQLEDAITLEALAAREPADRDKLLLPPDSLLTGLAAVRLDGEQTRRLRMGQTVNVADTFSGQVRVYAENAQFLGLGLLAGDGHLTAQRLMATN